MMVSEGIMNRQARNRGTDQVLHRVGAHAGQGVDLLGDAHRAQLGGHRAADPAGEHRGGEHRAQFADHRHVDDGAEPRFHAERAELVYACTASTMPMNVPVRATTGRLSTPIW